MIGFILGAVISPIAISVGLYLYIQVQFSELKDINFSPPELPIEKEVSLDWNIQALDGTEFNLADKFNNEFLFLNFWATWCPPCVAEMPSIERLYQQFKGRMKFACISKEDLATINSFKKKKGYTFPIYHIKNNLPEEFNTDGIPATFIVSTAGQIKLKHVGGADWAHESVVNYLEGLLTAKTEQVAAADSDKPRR